MHVFISLILNLVLGLSVVAQSQPRPCCCVMQVLNERPSANANEVASFQEVTAGEVDESLPPCCRGKADASSNTSSEDSAPCQCRFQFEEGARLEASSDMVRLPLLPAFDFLPRLNAHIEFRDILDSSIVDRFDPDVRCATLPIRAELCTWRC